MLPLKLSLINKMHNCCIPNTYPIDWRLIFTQCLIVSLIWEPVAWKVWKDRWNYWMKDKSNSSSESPWRTISSFLSEYYRIVHLQLKEIANLLSTSNLPEKELFDHIHKVDFVQFRILTFLPESFSRIFIEEMEKVGWNFNTIDGKKAFSIMLDLTGKLYRCSEQLNQILTKNKKQRNAHSESPPK